MTTAQPHFTPADSFAKWISELLFLPGNFEEAPDVLSLLIKRASLCCVLTFSHLTSVSRPVTYCKSYLNTGLLLSKYGPGGVIVFLPCTSPISVISKSKSVDFSYI